jgi:hypothetical protein
MPTAGQPSVASLSVDSPSFEVLLPAIETGAENDVVIRMDVSRITAELNAFLV